MYCIYSNVRAVVFVLPPLCLIRYVRVHNLGMRLINFTKYIMNICTVCTYVHRTEPCVVAFDHYNSDIFHPITYTYTIFWDRQNPVLREIEVKMWCRISRIHFYHPQWISMDGIWISFLQSWKLRWHTSSTHLKSPGLCSLPRIAPVFWLTEHTSPKSWSDDCWSRDWQGDLGGFIVNEADKGGGTSVGAEVGPGLTLAVCLASPAAQLSSCIP